MQNRAAPVGKTFRTCEEMSSRRRGRRNFRNANCREPGHGKTNFRLDRTIQVHGLGGALPAAVHGGLDAVSQHRQNTELQRDNQFISIAALHQSAGRVRHRDGPAEALLAVLIIMGLWVRKSALVMSLGILLMFAWGGFGAGEPEFAWLGYLRLPDRFGRRTVRLRRGSDPVRPKKMTNRTIICTPAISIFGEIL